MVLLSRFKRFFTRPHLRLIRFIGVIVPRRLRADWRQEWEAELRHREALLAEWDRLDRRHKLELLWRSTSAFWDALWLQQLRWEDDMFQDLRYGVRMLFKHKSFTAVAVVMLALGIGANTAIFSVVNGVLLRSLPYHQPERLVILENALITYRALDEAGREAAWQNRFDWQERVQSFEALSAFSIGDGGVNVSGPFEPKRAEAVEVSANFFETLGVSPLLGRSFAPEEEQPGKQMVAVISYDLWQRELEGAVDTIGTTLALNGKSFTIIGVAPPGFLYPRKVSLWIPLAPSLSERIFTNPGIKYDVFGRLREGVTPEQANSETVAAVRSYLPAEQPGRASSMRPVKVVPLLDSLVGDIRKVLTLLLGAVMVVLLIACANVANLLLAAGSTRRRELAVRSALGASRGRLLRQTLTESIVLAMAGGALGLVLSLWLVGFLVSLSPPQLPRLADITLDYRVLCFALSVSLLTGLLVGLLPALQSTRIDLNAALKEGARSSSAGWGGRRVRSALVVSQVALSLVLMVGAGLLIRSFVNVLKVPKGFSTDNVLTVSLSLPPAHYPTPEGQREFFRQILERLESQPLIESVGVTNKAPLNKSDVIGLLFDVEGVTPPSQFDQRIALLMSASPDYFRTMGIAVVQGRNFSPSDTQGAPPVIIINEGLARRYFSDGKALGKRLKVLGEKQPREIVGVVNDVRSLGLEKENWQEMFLPYLQGGPRPTTLVLRCAAEPSTALRAVQEAVNALDKDLPLYDVRTMRQLVYDSVAQRSYLLWLMGALAVIGLLLTTSGIFGVISYSVTQRTHEIGIQLALGAQNGQVLRLVMRETLWLVALGLGLGALASLAATRWLVSLLYGLKTNDPSTMAAAAFLLMCVALCAG